MVAKTDLTVKEIDVDIYTKAKRTVQYPSINENSWIISTFKSVIIGLFNHVFYQHIFVCLELISMRKLKEVIAVTNNQSLKDERNQIFLYLTFENENPFHEARF